MPIKSMQKLGAASRRISLTWLKMKKVLVGIKNAKMVKNSKGKN